MLLGGKTEHYEDFIARSKKLCTEYGHGIPGKALEGMEAKLDKLESKFYMAITLFGRNLTVC